MAGAAIKPRSYQIEAISALEAGFAAGDQRLGVSLPTGVGKTVILAILAHRWSRTRVLILVHRDELVDQTVDKLRRLDRQLSVGVVKASRNEGGAAVVVASVQTICRPRRLAQIGRFGLIICDEAHRSMAQQWQVPLAALGATDPNSGVKVAGFSATWVRSDRIGLADFWQKIVYRKTAAWAIEQGYLVPPIGKAVRIDLDMSGVKQIGGDYSDKALGIALTDETVAKAIVHAYRLYAADRQGVLFAPTVASARFFAGHLQAAGFSTECVFGETPRDERQQIYSNSRRGKTQIMASCGVLAEGFDAPWLEAGILARPTLHPGLFIQQVGRVLRTSPETGKQNALILDVVGATELHKIDWWAELTHTEPTDERELSEEDMEIPVEGGGGRLIAKREARIIGFEDVALFGNQDAKWHRTVNKVMFVDCDKTFVFVEPHPEDPAYWRVGECSKRTMAQGKWVAEWLTSSADAMDWAGNYAIQKSPTTADRKASWRQKARHRDPSPGQIDYAVSLGINVDGLNAEELSDAITYVLASRVLAQVQYPIEIGSS